MIQLGLTEALYSMPRPRQERRALNARDLVFAEWAESASVTAGVRVTQETARSISAYWNGVCVISGDLGAMDKHAYRRVGDDDRERATTHPAYKLINGQPNPDMTAMVFWETFVSHVVSWGNGYAEIEYDNALRPIALHLITPDLMEPKLETLIDRKGRKTQRVFYLYRGQHRLEREDVFHVPGLGFDGVRGYSPVYLARQSLGLAIAQEQFGAAFFGNGTWAGVALEHPGELGDEALANLRESFEARHQGSSRAFRPLILEEGMRVSKPITIPPDDAQFLESRSFTIEEIARWLNLPPHKLKHKVGERPGGNLESSELDYQITTLVPIAKRIEQECDRKLLGGGRQLYTEFNFASRLKPDTETRMLAYEKLHGMKVLSAPQIARMENLPRPQEPAEDLSPLDPRPAEAPTPVPPAPSAPPQDRGRVVAAGRALLLSLLARCRRREAEQARRAADKGPEAFGQWVERYYGPAERTLLVESIEPAVGLLVVARGSDADPRAVAEAFATRYFARSRGEMEALPVRTIGPAVRGLAKRWESTRGLDLAEELIAACGAAEEAEDVA